MNRLGRFRAFVAAAFFAAACAQASPYRPPPDGSFTTGDAALEIANVTATVHTAAVTPAFFPTTGGAPLLGRLFIDGDRAGAPVVVLSDQLWESKFGKDPAIIGRPVRLDGLNAVIVGVMPGGFQIPAGTDVWTPQNPR
jgi:hypothetical protein